MKRRAAIVLGLITVCVGLDQGTKRMAIQALKNQLPRTYLNNMVQLFYAENTGAFGSLGANWPRPLWMVAFVLLPIVVLGAVMWHALRSPNVDTVTVVASTLVTAGGLGNVVDRVVDGFVVDFMYIKVGPLATNVFNVADLAVMAGVILLLLHRPKATPTPAEPPAAA
jgi:signal peptidase II